MSSFADFQLLPSLIDSLAEQGIVTPTEIQRHALPELLQGRPVIGVAETGSGKTLSYVLPMLHQLKSLELADDPVSSPSRPRGLVVVPARELGDQVSRVFKSLTHGTRLRVRTVIGGTKKQMARQSVSGPFEILVATPGRLVQLMDEHQLTLNDVRMLVFDEADQMLDPGFLPTARRVIKGCPSETRVALFSATFPKPLDAVVKEVFVETPRTIRTRGSQRVVPTLRTENRTVVDGRRYDVLATIFAQDQTTGTLIFANTRKQCDTIGEWLANKGIPFVAYRGEMDRKERRDNLAAFRSGDVSVLIATDLAGRGLDVERIKRVINVYLPHDIDNYLHRVGRTARAGRKGLVINLVTERDRTLLAQVDKMSR